MPFTKAGSCPKCGAPIWIPDSWAQANIPPPITYSCLCHGSTKVNVVIPLATVDVEKFQELENKVKELEMELGTLKRGILPKGKREVLKG
jgi:hypothetical protein